MGKRYESALKTLDLTKSYPIEEALKLLKSFPKTKADETVDLAFNLGIDVKHSDQQVRGTVSLPAGLGKKVCVAVITSGEKIQQAQAAGADLVGADDVIKDIEAGKINFDVLIATPDMMAKIGKVAKIIGPKGLMPNPKSGTVTQDVSKAVKDFKAGKVEYKADKGGVVHVPAGKLSFTEEQLLDNIKALFSAIQKSKPVGAKGIYMRKITLTSTHNPGIRLEIRSME